MVALRIRRQRARKLIGRSKASEPTTSGGHEGAPTGPLDPLPNEGLAQCLEALDVMACEEDIDVGQ